MAVLPHGHHKLAVDARNHLLSNQQEKKLSLFCADTGSVEGNQRKEAYPTQQLFDVFHLLKRHMERTYTGF
jgi:hypothetical protein